MRAIIGGPIVAKDDPRPYQGRDGSPHISVDFYIGSSDPRYGAERASCDISLAPEVGEVAYFEAMLTAKLSAAGKAWQSVNCVRRVDAEIRDFAKVPAHSSK